MTGPLSAGEVGYRGHDDVVLRGALYEVWNTQCVGCGLPQKFIDTQIDHLIPWTIKPAELSDLISFHGLPIDFHVHRPANLALICGPCNNKKSNRLLKTLSMTLALGTARRHSPKVVRLVHEHVTARKVALGLIAAARADLSDSKIRNEFVQHAPAIVQTLALLDESKADFLADRSFDLNAYDTTVPLSLDARGRTAEAVVESLCGDTLADALAAGIGQLLADLKDNVAARFYPEGSEDADWLPVAVDRLEIAVEFADFARRGKYLRVQFAGMLYAEFVSAAAQSADDGDGLVNLDAWGYQDCAFKMSLSWNIATGPNPDRRVAAKITTSHYDQSVSRT